MSRTEELVTALLNGESVEFEPSSRIEEYLLKCLEGNADNLPTPISRLDILLHQLATKLSDGSTGGGGGSAEPSVNKLAQLADRSITEVTAEDLAGVTSIGKHAFHYCEKLVSVIIPDSVTSIKNEAFGFCDKLTSVIVPDSVTGWLEEGAFRNCTNLTSATIGNGVTNVGYYVFMNCHNLTSVVIGNNVKSFGDNVFTSSKLKSVTIKAETPPTIQSNTFKNAPADCAFYVPAASVEAYKAATNWSARADYIFPIEE